ncbi:hypothetical protein HK096_005368 [Nowakowskiella sp. JEL0078]|nr:hypothetical protein HK096_005368 [Nowakowskiella sp. JEL0078]
MVPLPVSICRCQTCQILSGSSNRLSQITVTQMKLTVKFVLFALSLFPTSVLSWGQIGHTLVANIAQSFLTETTIAELNAQKLLDKYEHTLYTTHSSWSIATWADRIKRFQSYRWANILHYSDAEDDPPNVCSYDYIRDCPEQQCIVAAIANYTSRLECSNKLNVLQKVEALEFLTHFLGDITNPLHASGRDRGGNDHRVRYHNRATNLHAVWDYMIIEDTMSIKYGGNIAQYTSSIVEDIKTGKYSDESSEWVACTDPAAGTSCPEVKFLLR